MRLIIAVSSFAELASLVCSLGPGPVADAGRGSDWSMGRSSRRTVWRRWRMVVLLAAHPGTFTAADVMALVGASKATVHRDLTVLHDAGLLARFTVEGDRSHRWFYTITDAGVQHITGVLEGTGRPVPANVGEHAGAAAVPLLVLLSAQARTGLGHVVSWRTGVDVAVWLRERHGVDGVQVDALGVWAEGDRAIRFLVLAQWVGWWPAFDRLTDRLHESAETAALPVHAMLLVTDGPRTEGWIHDALQGVALTTVTVATTTWDRLYGPDGPAGAIWSTLHEPGQPRRLIELGQDDPLPVNP